MPVPNQEDEESEESVFESLEDRKVEKDSKTDLGNPFPERIVGNLKHFNGCELLEQAFPTKRL